MRTVTKFWILRGKYLLHCRLNDTLVRLHIRTTPALSTPDILTDLIQERLRVAIRRNEFRCHALKTQYEKLGTEIVKQTERTTNNA